MERNILANAASRTGLACPEGGSTGGFDAEVVLVVVAGVLAGWHLSKIQCFNLWR